MPILSSDEVTWTCGKAAVRLRAAASVAATVAAELCRKLYAGGVRQLHFYTMNKAELSYAICHLLGVRAAPVQATAAAA